MRPESRAAALSFRSLRRRGRAVAAALIAGAALLAGCDSGPAATAARDEPVAELEVWMPAGSAAERETLQEQAARFNAMQYRVRVTLEVLPRESYAGRVREAADAGALPDILGVDGPYIQDYIQRGYLIPLDKLLTDNSRLDLFPSVIGQGSYHGRMYTVSSYDTGLGIYARPSLLRAAGARIPGSIGEAWSAEEFDRVLQRLAGRDADGAVLDLGLAAKGEWYSYAFLPVVQSAGGDLVDRAGYRTAAGRLNREGVVAAMSRLQSWVRKGYVDMGDDGAAFLDGRVALSWGDHTAFHRYEARFPGDVVLLPLPDFGHGPRTAQGGWGWAVSATCKDRHAAMRFIEYLLQPEQVLATSAAADGIPATRSAASRATLYRDDGPLHFFMPQLENATTSRPGLPAYPALSEEFQHAFDDIVHGADVRSALDTAVKAIDARLNGGV
ncbi:MAG: extracellular solute-binding protein [Gammaproteobacteria bacterium]|nr:extracellular solute-binding protein [Gammaproteobacteria bacterium]